MGRGFGWGFGLVMRTFLRRVISPARVTCLGGCEINGEIVFLGGGPSKRRPLIRPLLTAGDYLIGQGFFIQIWGQANGF